MTNKKFHDNLLLTDETDETDETKKLTVLNPFLEADPNNDSMILVGGTTSRKSCRRSRKSRRCIAKK